MADRINSQIGADESFVSNSSQNVDLDQLFNFLSQVNFDNQGYCKMKFSQHKNTYLGFQYIWLEAKIFGISSKNNLPKICEGKLKVKRK